MFELDEGEWRCDVNYGDLSKNEVSSIFVRKIKGCRVYGILW